MMMKTALLALFALLLSAPAAVTQTPLPAVAGQAGFEDDWTSVLQRIVRDDGRVAYAAAAGSDFDRARRAVETFDAGRLTTDDEKLAFWINAYNVKMVEAIAARPNARHLEKQNLFDELFKSPVTVAGRDVTLDQIEHVILRRQDGPAALKRLAVREVTPLIHVGLNCAAVSCPPLGKRAYAPAWVLSGLEDQLYRWVQSSRFARVEGDTVVLSSLVDWFGADFDVGGEKAGDYLCKRLCFSNRCGTFSPGQKPIQPLCHDQSDALKEVLEGKTAAQIKALPNVRFAYDWTVARAE